METLQFTILPGEYSIHRFSPIKTVPKDVYKSDFLSIVFTDNELSLICNSSIDIESEKKDDKWTCIKLIGEFDIEITGVWAKITSTVASAGSPVLAITTFDTDYFLVKTKYLKEVKNLFELEKYRFI